MTQPLSTRSDFRFYRRLVTATVMGSVTLGAIHLLVSIGLTIHRRRHVDQAAQTVTAPASATDVASCLGDVNESRRGLEKHLESFSRLLDHYETEMVQAWEDEGAMWRNEWRAVGQRCHFGAPARGAIAKHLDALAVAHAELGETQTIYTKELRRFGREQAPRLDRVRERLEAIERQLQTSAGP